MATWNKEEIIIPIVDATTGVDYTASTITVEVYPFDNTYPAGAINCSRLGTSHRYMPDSDLDDNNHYMIRWTIGVDSYERVLISRRSYPNLG